jgi:plasmid stabilization system protein ParE
MRRPARVRATENFARNLDCIRDWLTVADATPAFERLLEELRTVIFPNLGAFPAMGADFLARRPRSVAGRLRVGKLRHTLGAKVEIRELIHADYLILYAVRDDALFLLAIKHHRQLAFDFAELWRG